MKNINDYCYINEYIAKEIKKQRLKYGYSLTDVSAKLGITKQRYCNYEMGIRAMPINTYVDACKLFDIDAEKLFEEAQAFMRKQLFKNARK